MPIGWTAIARRSVFAVALLGLMGSSVLAADGPATPTLTAMGQGMVKAEPDVALISLGVVSQAATARAALDANSADAQKLIATVKGAGIADKDIATTNFSVDPVYAEVPPNTPPPEGGPRIVGYRVTNQVRVRILGVARSGDLLDKVIAAGANRVSGLSFEIDQPEPLRDMAVRNAIADAQRKGQLMADAAGVRLVRVLSVTTGEEPVPVFDKGIAFAARAAPPIEAGQQTISASATLVFEIAPK